MVAVLLHQGYYASSNVTCNPLISRFYAQVNLLPPQEQYLSATRNAVRSRCWFAKTEGCSYQVRGGVCVSMRVSVGWVAGGGRGVGHCSGAIHARSGVLQVWWTPHCFTTAAAATVLLLLLPMLPLLLLHPGGALLVADAQQQAH